MKKLMALLLCVIFSIAALVPSVSAVSSDYGKKGKYTSGVFTYSLINKKKEVRIEQSPKAKGKVTIPSKIAGKPVTQIGAGAFYANTKITSVKIPASVKSIAAHAFDCNEKLKTVTFAKGSKLTSIGDMAFAFCSSLASIKLPSKLKTIGKYAFASCKKLSKATLTQSITKIDAYAFMDCGKLKSLTINAKVKVGKKYTLPKYAGKWKGGNSKLLKKSSGSTYKAQKAGKTSFNTKNKLGLKLVVNVTVSKK